MMNNPIVQYFMDQLKDKGFHVLLLVLAVYFLYDRQNDLEDKIDACNESKFELLENMNQKMIEVIERNTIALELCK